MKIQMLPSQPLTPGLAMELAFSTDNANMYGLNGNSRCILNTSACSWGVYRKIEDTNQSQLFQPRHLSLVDN